MEELLVFSGGCRSIGFLLSLLFYSMTQHAIFLCQYYVQLETGIGDIYSSVFIVQDCFRLLRYLCFHIIFNSIFSSSMKKITDTLTSIALNLLISVDWMDTFTIWITQIKELRTSFDFLRSSPISFFIIQRFIIAQDFHFLGYIHPK